MDAVVRVLRPAAARGDARPEAVTARIAGVGPRLIIIEHMDHGTVSDAEIEGIVTEVVLPLLTPR
jgi:hypothetical protein